MNTRNIWYSVRSNFPKYIKCRFFLIKVQVSLASPHPLPVNARRGSGLLRIMELCPRNVVLRNSWHIFTRNLMNLIQTNRARSRMLSTSVRRDVVHEVCSASWERKLNLGGCGRASSSHGRTLRSSGTRKGCFW